jgi:glycoprotein-N-acetylgalactosamine 3-beta-galactosyltransferase
MPHASRYQGAYKGLWQRTRSILGYPYMYYMEDYDYFHMSGDDTYVMVENLRQYLTSPQIVNLTQSGQPFFGGFWTPWYIDGTNPDFYYLGGASGDTWNVLALKMYIEDGPTENCSLSKKEGSAEDVNIAWCF